MLDTKNSEFSKVYESHKALVMAVCNMYSQGHEKDDLFQEIWTEVFRSLNNFKGNAKLSTWIYSVARNTAISFLKKRSNQPLPSLSPQVSPPQPKTPEEILFSREEVKRFMVRLSPEEQEILLQKYLFHLSYEELSKRLSIPVSTVKSRLFEARKRMRDFFFSQDPV